MANKKHKRNIIDERIEDNTMYGEFIHSFQQWITSDRQRAAARYQGEILEHWRFKRRKRQIINSA